MKKLLVAVAVAGLVGTANAQSAFEGFYGQVGIGYESTSMNSTAGRLTSGTYSGTAYSTSFNNTNAANISIGIGNYFSITPTFLLGIGAEYSPLPSSKSNYSVTAGGTTTNNDQWSKNNSYSIFASPAYAIDKTSLIYGKVGYTGISIKNSPSGESSSNTNYNGYLLGLGYRQVIDGGLYGFVESNYSQYSSKTDDGGTGSTKPKTMNVMLGIGYKF